ncbi:MAG: rRNA maturation RNase YbeY [Rhodospirillales bacterium]
MSGNADAAGGPGSIRVDVSVRHAPWRRAAQGVVGSVRAAARAAAGAARPALPPVEISVVLADDAFVAGLNEGYRGKAGPTNVLSFPALDLAPRTAIPRGPAGTTALGDVVLAFETTRREAAESGRPVADHLAHLVVHGVLHLLGYDHETAAQARRMEALEVSVLAGLGIANPYHPRHAVRAR